MSKTMFQVKEQKEEAERFQRKLKEIEELKVESFLVQLFHINRVSQRARQFSVYIMSLFDTIHRFEDDHKPLA